MLRGGRRGFLRSAPTSCLCRQLRACRGRSRHAPATLGRRKQIGLPAGVQAAGRPWLASHRRSVGPGCGEHQGRGDGMEGTDLAAGSPQVAASLSEARHNLGLMRGWGCCPCLSLPLVLRWTCSLTVRRCRYAVPQPSSPSPHGKLLTRAQPVNWGSSDPNPPYPSQLYSDAFDLVVNQSLSLLRYAGGWGCSMSPLSPAGPRAAAIRLRCLSWAMGGTRCPPCRPRSSWDQGRGTGMQCPE